jgi:WD40 repeat protein
VHAQVTAGSADRMVYVWEVASRKLLYKLPGHSGSVNEAVFHPKEPIVASAGSDARHMLFGQGADCSWGRWCLIWPSLFGQLEWEMILDRKLAGNAAHRLHDHAHQSFGACRTMGAHHVGSQVVL